MPDKKDSAKAAEARARRALAAKKKADEAAEAESAPEEAAGPTIDGKPLGEARPQF